MRKIFSVFNLSHNFSISLSLHTHYVNNVFTTLTTITTIHLSHVLCQLSSKPADQKHVNSVRGVSNHTLTHICIISPVLRKKRKQYHKKVKVRRFQITELQTMQWRYAEVFDFLLTFRNVRNFAKGDCLFALFVCPSVRSPAWSNSAPKGPNFL